MARKYKRPYYRKRVKAADHIDFECASFYEQIRLTTAVRMKTVPVPEEWRPVVARASLESWLIHTRALMCFFYEYPSWKYPDVLARDYLTEKRWTKNVNFFVPDDDMKERIEDIGGFVAHISYRRSVAGAAEATRWGQEFNWVRDRLERWYSLLDLRWQDRFPRLRSFLTPS